MSKNDLKETLDYWLSVCIEGENMNLINYLFLTEQNFNENSLDCFCRHQEVKECWRKNNNEYVLIPNKYVEDWDINKRKEVAREILKRIAGDGFAYGAFYEGKVVGYILISNELFGKSNQYMELLLYHVSEPYRRRGIGKELFKLACHTAKRMGAKKLYISAHSSKESQAAYHQLGCVEATEINQMIAEKEPYDVQMEFVL